MYIHMTHAYIYIYYIIYIYICEASPIADNSAWLLGVHSEGVCSPLFEGSSHVGDCLNVQQTLLRPWRGGRHRCDTYPCPQACMRIPKIHPMFAATPSHRLASRSRNHEAPAGAWPSPCAARACDAGAVCTTLARAAAPFPLSPRRAGGPHGVESGRSATAQVAGRVIEGFPMALSWFQMHRRSPCKQPLFGPT